MLKDLHPAGGMSPINEVCMRNGVGRSYLYAEIKAGRLRAVKVGRHTHVKHEDEIAWRNSLPVASRIRYAGCRTRRKCQRYL